MQVLKFSEIGLGIFRTIFFILGSLDFGEVFLLTGCFRSEVSG